MPSKAEASEALARVCGPKWSDVDSIIRHCLNHRALDLKNKP